MKTKNFKVGIFGNFIIAEQECESQDLVEVGNQLVSTLDAHGFNMTQDENKDEDVSEWGFDHWSMTNNMLRTVLIKLSDENERIVRLRNYRNKFLLIFDMNYFLDVSHGGFDFMDFDLSR